MLKMIRVMKIVRIVEPSNCLNQMYLQDFLEKRKISESLELQSFTIKQTISS